LGARATFKLCRYENNGYNSRSRLDITLAHNFYDDITAMSIASNGNIGIGTSSPGGKLDIYDGFIYSNGHKQPFSRTGTVSGIDYVDIPTLFNLATTTVHTCEIVFQWHITANIDRFASLYGISSGGTQLDPFEVGYAERPAWSSYTNSSGNVIARNIISGQEITTKIRIPRITGNEPRSTYMCESVFGFSNVGTYQNISSGYFRDGNISVVSLRIKTSATTALIYGRWTATYYHV
jgi:hypothetical protein